MAKMRDIGTQHGVVESTRRKTMRAAQSSSKSKLPMASDYTVGYGRPPTSTQFRPGHCGNPKGRPKKGSKKEDTMARETLEQKIDIDKDGRPRKLSVRQVAFQRIGEKASSGDLRSINFLLAKETEERQLGPDHSSVPAKTALEIIRGYFERQRDEGEKQ